MIGFVRAHIVTHINPRDRDWPSDALKKSAETILEELSIERNKKKLLIDKTLELYSKSR